MASATKQALLAALSAAQGECISGQQLARQLGVSRAAVHKAAAALAVLGYGSAEINAALKAIDVDALTLEDIIRQALKRMMK